MERSRDDAPTNAVKTTEKFGISYKNDKNLTNRLFFNRVVCYNQKKAEPPLSGGTPHSKNQEEDSVWIIHRSIGRS